MQGLAQIARMCFLIMHRCVMEMQRHRNHYFQNLHTPPPPSLKKDGSSKICWKSHFSKSIFWLILRVVWGINGTKMEFKNFSMFVLHSLECFLDFLSIVFAVEHCEFKKKRWIIENMLKISFFKVDFLVDSESCLSYYWYYKGDWDLLCLSVAQFSMFSPLFLDRFFSRT